MAGSCSDYLEKKIIDHFDGKASTTSVTPIYGALCTVAIVDADTGSTITEATYTGYARKSIAAADLNAASGTSASATNANVIEWAACTAGSSAVIGVALLDASTLGNMLWFSDVTSTTVSTSNTPARIAAGNLTITQS